MKRTTVMAGLFFVTLTAQGGVTIPMFTPIDVPMLIDPIFVLDPCTFADVKLDIGAGTAMGSDVGGDYFTSTSSRVLMAGGSPVGQVITDYRRVTTSEGEFVTMTDTFIVNGSLTAFGRSSNDVRGFAGARGIVTEILDASGQKVDLDVTYLVSDFGTSGSVNAYCFFSPDF